MTRESGLGPKPHACIWIRLRVGGRHRRHYKIIRAYRMLADLVLGDSPPRRLVPAVLVAGARRMISLWRSLVCGLEIDNLVFCFCFPAVLLFSLVSIIILFCFRGYVTYLFWPLYFLFMTRTTHPDLHPGRSRRDLERFTQDAVAL